MANFVESAKVILRQPGFAGLLVATFALGAGHSFVSPFMSLWGTKEVGMRPVVFGLFMTATSLCAILVSTTLARWSDTHVPRKTMLLLGGVGGVLGYAGYALIRDPKILVLIGATALAVSAVSFSQLFAYTREQFFKEVSGVPPGFLTSVVRVCFSLAWTAGPTIGAWMMVRHGFRGLFLGAAASYLVFLVIVARYVASEPRSAVVRNAVRVPVWRILTRGDVFAVFCAFLCVFAAHTINMLNLPSVITEVLGGSGTDVGITFGVGPAAEIPLMLWFGHLAARGHQLALIRIGAVVTTVYFLLLIFVRAPWQVFPLQVLHGLSFAIISNIAILFFQDLVPGQPGLATTVFTNAASLGSLVGYFGFGALVEPLGHRGIFALSAILTVVMGVIMFFYRARPSPNPD